MADDVIVCVTEAEAIALAAKINASSRTVATQADRSGQQGWFRPLSECVTERATEVQVNGASFVVPIPTDRSKLSAAEKLRVVTRPTVERVVSEVNVKGK